jgi:Flp pilus assembly protein protease CpaA
MIQEILLVLGLVLFFVLIYAYKKDLTSGHIPQNILFIAFGVGYLTYFLALILGVNYGDNIFVYLGTSLAFFLLILIYPKNILGGEI